ncbi:MAG: choice-of-anchor tandem repeat GloVer-containing protein [Candidatus Korobacteraceae bacterium]
MAIQKSDATLVSDSQSRAGSAGILSVVLLLAVVFAGPWSQAQTNISVHYFRNTPDGWQPWGGLAMDRAGNLYGTTQYGGTSGYGLVFKLSKKGSNWLITPLYSFPNPAHGNDGAVPMARLTIGPDGSLYGTTSAGGTGWGTVFNLKPPAQFCRSFLCPWTETVLYRFSGGGDGGEPESPVAFDPAGNIYGTTVYGGSANDGVVFELTRSGSAWTEIVLHSFTGSPDGAAPASGVTFDAAGNVYGTATSGGASDDGIVYRLTRSGSGWTEDSLHAFDYNNDGAAPFGGVIFDNSGNLYGTTAYSSSGYGTVFELTPSGGGWNYLLLYQLTGESSVTGPLGPLVMDAAGNLYGTTVEGGDVYGVSCEYGCGTVFELSPSSGGWVYRDMYDFMQSDAGRFPTDGVVMDANGNLYGIGSGLGDFTGGGVFEITP